MENIQVFKLLAKNSGFDKRKVKNLILSLFSH